MKPYMRLPTVLLALGAAVLLLAVAIGERMGDRVIGQATERTLESVGPVSVSPSPGTSPQAYGPDWKRSQALSASGDPRFPDPRVPPQPLPTLPPPTATPRPTPVPTPTPNPNVPIWRRQPLPTVRPSPTPSEQPSGLEGTPTPEGSAQPSPPPVP